MMKKLNNPYIDYEGYNCFGCAPGNESGLRMEFYEDGDDIVSFWEPTNHFQGYSNVLHGGIQGALMDEIGSWVLFVKLSTSGATSKMEVNYLKPVYTNKGKITLRASPAETEGRLVCVNTSLYDPDEQLCTTGRMYYYTVPEKIARRRFFYPGREAFF